MTTATATIGENLGVQPGKARWKALLGWLAIVLLAGAGGIFAYGKWKESASAPTVQYRTEQARIGNLTVTVTATGQLQPNRNVNVGSEVSGIIDSVEVNYNDRVVAGQVLARINTERLVAQVSQDKALLDTARAKVSDAKVTTEETGAEYKRMQSARASSNNQLPSQHDLDTAKAAYERAKVSVLTGQAAVTQAEATLRIDETNVSKAVIRSPVNGVVLARNVEPGQTIAASFAVTTMFELADDLSRMKLLVNIDEADVGEVKEAQNVSFTVDAYPGRHFPGRVKQLRYQATTTNNVVTYLAEITVDNHEMLLRPGMTATAVITVKSQENALLVPNVALRFTPAQVGANQKADERSIVSKLMPGPPPMTKRAAEPDAAASSGTHVWVLRDQQPVAVAVKTGLTSGKMTEVLSGSIAAGVPLIVEAVRSEK